MPVEKKLDLTTRKEPTQNSEPNFNILSSTAFVPEWSKAFKNPVSNYVRMLEPLLKCFNAVHAKLDDLLSNSSIRLKSFKLQNRPDKITDSKGNRYLEYNNINTSYYKSIEVESVDSSHPTLFLSVFIPYLPFTTLFLEEESKIYIKQNAKNLLQEVTIVGLDDEGKRIEEKFFLTDDIVQESLSLFKQVTSVTSSVPLEISNFVDCSKTFFVKQRAASLNPLFISQENSFQSHIPDIKLGSNLSLTQTTLDIMEKFNSSVFKYSFGQSDITSLYVDKYMNAHYTNNNQMYVVPLALDLYGHSKDVSDSANKYIYTNDRVLTGEWLKVKIDLNSYFQDYGKDNVLVYVKHENELYYLDSKLSLMQTERKYVSPRESPQPYEIELFLEDSAPYVFNIVSENFRHSFTIKAATVGNHNTYPIEENSTLIVYNGVLKLAKFELQSFYDNSVTSQSFLNFTWEHYKNLEYKLWLPGLTRSFTTSDRFLEEDLIKPACECTTSVSSLLLNIEKIKKIYSPSAPLEIKVAVNWEESCGVPTEIAEAFVRVNHNGLLYSVPIAPTNVESDKWQLKIVFNEDKTVSIFTNPEA